MCCLCCPHCQRYEVKNHGKTGEGKQRYLYQNRRCHVKTFLLSEDYTYQGCRPHIDTQIIVQTLRAVGIRDIAKTLQISCVKVINTIKSKAATIRKRMLRCQPKIHGNHHAPHSLANAPAGLVINRHVITNHKTPTMKIYQRWECPFPRCPPWKAKGRGG